MNHSNRYGPESMAKQRQAAIPNGQRQQAGAWTKIKWAATGTTALSVVGAVALVVVAHPR